MPTTFNVFFLGNTGTFQLDPTEGNTSAENATAFVGASTGTAADPLYERIQEFAPGSTGFGGGNATVYDQNNNAVGGGETFTLDGGPEQTFDGSAVYDSTITYTDGTTATITAVIFQDTAGNVYLAPEFSGNADQAALEAQPIQGISLGALTNNQTNYAGLTGNRQTGDFAVCFTTDSRVLTPSGYRAITDLRPGDRVSTVDSGAQRIEWIGRSRHDRTALRRNPAFLPVLLQAGTFGAIRNTLVSQQHCIALGDSFVRARHLVDIPGSGARIARGTRDVEYIHLMCDRHQVLIADGVESESFYPGPLAFGTMDLASRLELAGLIPGLSTVETSRIAVERVMGPTARRVLRRCELRDGLNLPATLAAA